MDVKNSSDSVEKIYRGKGFQFSIRLVPWSYEVILLDTVQSLMNCLDIDSEINSAESSEHITHVMQY